MKKSVITNIIHYYDTHKGLVRKLSFIDSGAITTLKSIYAQDLTSLGEHDDIPDETIAKLEMLAYAGGYSGETATAMWTLRQQLKHDPISTDTVIANTRLKLHSSIFVPDHGAAVSKYHFQQQGKWGYAAVKVADTADPISSEMVRREIDILVTLNGHQNIIGYYGKLKLPDVGFVMELATTALVDMIIDSDHAKLSNQQKQHIAFECATAIAFLHSKHIVHFDIKPDNFLLLQTNSLQQPWQVKLCDFGLSAIPTADDFEPPGYTTEYTAPEIMKRFWLPVTKQIPLPAGYDFTATDMFAFGMVLGVLINGKHPYGHYYSLSSSQLLSVLATISQPYCFPVIQTTGQEISILPLIKQCLANDPLQRPKAQQCVTALNASQRFSFSELVIDQAQLSDAGGAGQKPNDGAQASVLFYKLMLNGVNRGVAVKIPYRDASRELVEREIEILRTVNGHDNIVTFYGIIANRFGHEKIVLGAMASDLRAMILNAFDPKKNVVLLNWHQQQIAYTLAKGLAYLHACGVLHSDLKPENLLVDPKNFIVKICDFGLSYFINDIRPGSTKPYGTPIFSAPEHLASQWVQPYELIDIYSVGLILSELTTGKECYKLFADERQSTGLFLRGLANGTIKPNKPIVTAQPGETSIATILTQCWLFGKRRNERPTANDLVKQFDPSQNTVSFKLANSTTCH